MKKTSKRLLSFLLAAVLVFSLGSVALAANTIPATDLVFSKSDGFETVSNDGHTATLKLYPGNTYTLKAYVTPTDYNYSYTWTSSDTSVISVRSASTTTASNTLTARKEGSSNVTITYTDSSSTKKSITCTVEVTKDSVESVAITGTAIKDGAVILKKGASETLTATATLTSGATQTSDITWKSSDPSVVGISSSGRLTALNVGTSTITASLGGKTSEPVTVKVYDIDAITIDGLKEGEHLTTGGTPSGNSKPEVELAAKVVNNTSGLSDADIIKLAGGITWKSSNENVLTVAKNTAADNKATIKAVGPGKATITATVGTVTKTIEIEVYGIALSSENVFLAAGNNTVVSAVYYPTDAKVAFSLGGENDFYLTSPSYAAGKASVTVIASSDAVEKDDPSILTATLTAGSTAFTDTANVKIGSSAITGVTLSPSTLNLSVGGTQSLKYTTTPANAGYQSISWSSSDTSVATVSSNGLVTAKGEGSCYIYVDFKDENGVTHRGTCSVKVSNSSKNITATATVGTSYSMTTIYRQISTAFYNQFGTTPTATARIKITPSALSYAQLYTSSSLLTPVTAGTYTLSAFSAMYLSPKSSGSYSISYELSSGTNEMAGIITFTITGGSEIVVNLDNLETYAFSQETQKNGISAYSAISSIIYATTKQNYDYILFSGTETGDRCGTLYDNYNNSNLSNRYYYRSSSQDYSVYDLYFVPTEGGTYTRTFTAYANVSYGNPVNLGTYTLKIVVPDSESVGDIYLNTTTSSTMNFSQDVFEDWYEEQTSASYYLSYVTFNSVSDDMGTFRAGSSAFNPGNGARFYSESYTGSAPSNSYYIKNVSYTAPRYTGYTRVNFTCYGGTTSSSTNNVKSGTLYICYTTNDVKNVSYPVKYGTTQDLRETDFLSVYQSAMNSTSSSTRLQIQLLDVPAVGTLYYNYTSSSSTGTKLTTTNIDNYKFYINGVTSSYSLDNLTYVPAMTGSGNISVPYVAYTSNGTPVYAGTLSFNYSTAKTLTCTSSGYTFKAGDFYSTTDSDPVAAVSFTQPASGVLYANYANGSGTAVTSATKFYTLYSSSGNYPLTALTYIPKAGFSGSVAISYTATTVGGSTYTGSVSMSVTSKTSSSQFSDVTASGVGTWAANSIDFAYSWGLVNGISTTTFDPNSTMTRAQLVTILYRAAGSPTVSGSSAFTDVASGSYYYNAVIWAAKNGIVTGTSNTTFNPNGNVTREQVAAILYRYASYKGMSTSASGSLSSYTDVSKVSSYATTALTWAVGKGIITSTSTTAKVLSPAGSATRAQVSVMLHRFLTF